MLSCCLSPQKVDCGIIFVDVQLQSPLDIFISHDWPRGIYNHGNSRRLLQNKRFFAEEVSYISVFPSSTEFLSDLELTKSAQTENF